MKIIDFLKDIFVLSKTDKSIIREEITMNNIERIFTISLVGAFIISFNYIILWLSIIPQNSIEAKWVTQIQTINFSLVISLVFFSIVSYLIKRYSYYQNFYTKIFIHLFYLSIPVFATLYSVADQLINNSIIAYIIGCTVISIIIIMQPVWAAIYFLVLYLVFYFLISTYQHDSLNITSLRINGLTSVAMGMCISWINFRNLLTKYRQNRIIEQHKKDYDVNYQRILKYSSELKELNATKDKLFSIISHDLRNTTGNIFTLSEILHQKAITNYPEFARITKEIYNATDITYKLVENLLTWSRCQTGKIEVHLVNIPLISIFDFLLNEIRHLAQNKNIEISTTGNINEIVLADENTMSIVFRNLLTNAVKFTNLNGKVQVRFDTYEKHVLITIEDNGIGIPAEKLKNIFETMASKSTRGTAGEAGTGLGLLLCKEFVILNNGIITAESQPNVGTKFIVTLQKGQKI